MGFDCVGSTLGQATSAPARPAGDAERQAVDYGRRDMVQRILTTKEVNHLSKEALARIESDRERTVLGLHPLGYYDG